MIRPPRKTIRLDAWVHTRVSCSSTRKRAPQKLFAETDFYTVKLDDGSRSLAIEDSFSVIEDRFARLRNCRLKEFAKLSEEERALLCVFTAMMSTRTKSQRANWTDFFCKLHDQVESMEKFHNAEPTTSLETAQMKEYTAITPTWAIPSISSRAGYSK